MSEHDAIHLARYASHRLSLQELRDIALALSGTKTLGGILALCVVNSTMKGMSA